MPLSKKLETEKEYEFILVLAPSKINCLFNLKKIEYFFTNDSTIINNDCGNTYNCLYKARKIFKNGEITFDFPSSFFGYDLINIKYQARGNEKYLILGLFTQESRKLEKFLQSLPPSLNSMEISSKNIRNLEKLFQFDSYLYFQSPSLLFPFVYLNISKSSF